VEARTICGRFGAIIKNFDSNVYSVGVLNQRRGKKKTKAPLSSIFLPRDIAILKILLFVQILPYFVTSSFGFEYCLSISWRISLDIIMFQFYMLLFFSHVSLPFQSDGYILDQRSQCYNYYIPRRLASLILFVTT